MSVGAAPYRRQERSPLQRITLAPEALPATLDAAYAAMRSDLASEPGRWGGWKLGGSNHASRAAFGVSQPYFGALDRKEILHQPDHAPGFALCEMKGEVEIALRIAPDGRGYDAWCVALEMPACPINNLMDLGVRALVADRCAAGALLLGPIQSPPLSDLATARFALLADGVELSAADITALIAPPEVLLVEFLALLARHGIPPRSGDWVATGGITACCTFTSGARVQVQMDGSDVLNFVASFEAADG